MGVALALVLLAQAAWRIRALSGRIAQLERSDPGRDLPADRSEPEWFRTAFDSAAVGMAVLSTRGEWLEANQAFFRLLGQDSRDLAGIDLVELSHPDDAFKGCGELCEVCAGTRDSCQFERRLLRRDGRLIWVSLVMSLARNEDSSPHCVIVQIGDVTERKRSHDELRAAKESAEAANRAKSQFLANMSHEIRTPIHAVIGMTGLAMEAELREEREKCLGVVTGSAKSLLAIVNDVLDFSKIEAGKLDLCPIDFGLRSCVEDTLTSFTHSARSKGVELSWRVDASVPEIVHGDPGRVRQILVNLISNALRFTERGEIEVNVRTISQREESVDLQLSVRDTGIGIPREKQEYIFDAFRQADGSTTRKYGGTGLGLSICRQLCDLMHGEIWLESEEGVGSTFFVSLGFGSAHGRGRSTREREAESTVDPQALSVLIVEDDVDSANELREQLVRTGAKVTLAIDRESGEAQVRKSIANDAPYSIVLCKTAKDGLDGFELARSLRVFLDFRGEIILLSTSGERGDARRCKDLRIAGYLTLPVDTTDLFEAITESVAKGPDSEERSLVTRHSIRERRRSLRVLVVEDNPFCQELASCLLEKWGHVAEVAPNGREALERISRADYDLILMDMQMPEMGGLEAIRHIRERERGRSEHVPIIALTASVSKDDVAACLEAGADEFLGKPVSPDGLESAVAEVYRRCRMRRSTSTKAPVDPNSIREHFGESYTEIAPRLAEVVLREQPEQVSSLEEALRGGDAVEVRRWSHTIKAAAAQFGAHEVRAVAERIETIALEGRLEEVFELLSSLKGEVVQFHTFLRETDWSFDSPVTEMTT